MDRSTDEAYKIVRSLIVDAALEFSNADIARSALIEASPTLNKVGFRLRDSLIYRYDSVLYHFDRLSQLHEVAARRVQDPRVMVSSSEFLRSVVRDQSFAFDDLIFNTIALFDYFGRFAGLLLQENESVKLRWDKLYKWAKHVDAGGKQLDNRIHGTRLGAAVIDEDQRWVRRLTEYRSKVIHYEAAKLDGSIKFSVSRNPQGKFEASNLVNVWIPTSFLRSVNIDVGESRTSVTEAASALMDRVFDASAMLLRALIADLEARMPPLPDSLRTSEPIVFRRR